jgi:hypothetical protein
LELEAEQEEARLELEAEQEDFEYPPQFTAEVNKDQHLVLLP